MKLFSALFVVVLVVSVTSVLGSTDSLTDEKLDFSRMVNTFKHQWASLVGKGKETIARIFGDTPFWDRTYEFRIPEVFRNLSLDAFMRQRLGAVPNTRADVEKLRRRSGIVLLEETEGLVATEDLPAEYNFFEKYPTCLKDPTDQSKCGSCWAFATMNALTHRVCKQVVDAGFKAPGKGEKDRLQPQFLVSCWEGSNACRGSQTFGAYTWMASNWASTGRCASYESWTGVGYPEKCPKMRESCTKANLKDGSYRRAAHRITIDQARIVIGEENIKREIFTNGPITVTMQTPANFIGASGKGVFSKGNAGWLQSGATHAFHAVVITGWGVDQETKQLFWILENSWSSIYRPYPNMNRGMLKVLRGSNDMGIETNLNVAGNPMILLEDGTKVSIKDGWNMDQKRTPINLSVRSERMDSKNNNDDDEIKAKAEKLIHDVEAAFSN